MRSYKSLMTLIGIVVFTSHCSIAQKQGSGDPRQAKEIFLKDTVFARPVEPEEGAENLKRIRALYTTSEDFEDRKTAIRKGMFYQLGLEPMPQRSSLNPIITGKQDQDKYTIENIALEILPGVWTYGNLYRPEDSQQKYPAVILAHGHGQGAVRGRLTPEQQLIASSLASMGAIVFSLDMFAYGESEKQVGVEAHRRGIAQTMNVLGCLAVLDYLTSLPEVDAGRIGITGASGGGTQSFLTAALDDRIAVSVPVVQVSCFFPGGCPCESGRPIHASVEPATNNTEIAAMAVPRPLLVISDGADWTRTVDKVEYPYIRSVYSMYGKEELAENVHLPDEGHDYGPSKRHAMYEFMGNHLGLNKEQFLNPDGTYNESSIKIVDPTSLLVFPDGKYPSHALTDLGDIFDELRKSQLSILQ